MHMRLSTQPSLNWNCARSASCRYFCTILLCDPPHLSPVEGGRRALASGVGAGEGEEKCIFFGCGRNFPDGVKSLF